MTWLLGESWDQYATIADAALGFWDVSQNWALSASPNGRFTGSQCLQNGAGTTGTYLSKASGSNDPTHHIVVAFQQTSALTGTSLVSWLQLLDGTTNQCCIVFRSDGAILLTSGGPTGTVLATATGLISQNSWVAFEFEITIDPTAGAFRIRKNGNTSNDFQATGLNTRGGTANSYANKLAVGANTSSSSFVQKLDDLLWFNTTGSAPNTWVGDVRSYPMQPAADVSKQFSISPTSYSAPTLTNTTNFTTNVGTTTIEALAAGTIRANFVQATSTGTAASATLNLNAAVTGHVKCALYANDSATTSPTTLLATSNEITNPAAGNNTFIFATPPSVAVGVLYWLAVWSDASVAPKTANVSTVGFNTTLTYAATFPSPMGGTSSVGGAQALGATLNITPSNVALVYDASEDGDTSYVYSSTVGQADFYSLGALPSTPQAIVGTQLRAFAKKSDTGTRALQMQLKSGTTTAQSASVALGTTYGWVNRVDTTDPNTGAAWTGTAVNAAQIGPLVSA